MSKAVIAIVIVIILAAGIWWWYTNQQNSAPAPTSGQSTPVVQTQPTASPNSAVQDNSDSALNQGLSSVDAQLSNLKTDSTNIDQGLNDKPIPQAQ